MWVWQPFWWIASRWCDPHFPTSLQPSHKKIIFNISFLFSIFLWSCHFGLPLTAFSCIGASLGIHGHFIQHLWLFFPHSSFLLFSHPISLSICPAALSSSLDLYHLPFRTAPSCILLLGGQKLSKLSGCFAAATKWLKSCSLISILMIRQACSANYPVVLPPNSLTYYLHFAQLVLKSPETNFC